MKRFKIGDKVIVKYLADDGRGHLNWINKPRRAKVIDILENNESFYSDYDYEIEFKDPQVMVNRKIPVHENEIEYESELEKEVCNVED